MSLLWLLLLLRECDADVGGVAAPDPTMEAYYVKERGQGFAKTPTVMPPVRLRGSGPLKQDSESIASIENSEDTPHDTSVSGFGGLELRGGAARRVRVGKAAQGPLSPEKPKNQARASPLFTALGGPSSGPEECWFQMHGYQGMVWFRTDRLFTFVDAVDRLLCLDNRGGVNYSLYLMDKRKKYATQAERDEFLSDLKGNGMTIWAAGPGDYGNDRMALDWLCDRIGATVEDQMASQKVLFVAGPADPIPWKWEPDDSHRIQEVSLVWPQAPHLNRPDVAYLRMPENPADVIYTNQYVPWMANVCRVLAAGRIPGRPGYPAIPDAWFTLRYPPGDNEGGTYGGLAFPPPFWDAMVKAWEDDQIASTQLQARTGPGSNDGTTDRWHLFFPGTTLPYEKQYILHSEVGNVQLVRQRIMDLLGRSMVSTGFSRIQAVEVYLPGPGFFLGSKPALEVPVSDTDGGSWDMAFQPVMELLVGRVGHLTRKKGVDPVPNGLGLYPQFLSLRPVFKRYLIGDADDVIAPLPWNPNTTTVDQFRHLAGRVFSALASELDEEQLYSHEKSWIAISQGRQIPPDNYLDENNPKLLVGPKTTEAEWESMRKLIVDSRLRVSLVDAKRLPRKPKRS